MSMRSEYEEYIARQEKLKPHPMAKYWINQESRYVKPFRMYGNLYYVGDDWVCAQTACFCLMQATAAEALPPCWFRPSGRQASIRRM